MILCDARIRPFPNAVIVMCEGPAGHDGMHAGDLLDYAYSGSKTRLSWAEDDRRTFRGDWKQCAWVLPGTVARCTLPVHHRGDHAI